MERFNLLMQMFGDNVALLTSGCRTHRRREDGYPLGLEVEAGECRNRGDVNGERMIDDGDPIHGDNEMVVEDPGDVGVMRGLKVKLRERDNWWRFCAGNPLVLDVKLRNSFSENRVISIPLSAGDRQDVDTILLQDDTGVE